MVNTTGNNNTGIGRCTLFYSTTGSYNTAIGYAARPGSGGGAYSNTTAIGNNATPTADNMVRIGYTAVTSIGGYAAWSNLRDIRFKKDIQPEEHGLYFTMQLKPITYKLDIASLNRQLYGKRADSLIQERALQKDLSLKKRKCNLALALSK